MKILVLGGNGFIGSNFCELCAEKAEIYSFDISMPEKQKEGIQYICGDYFDEKTLEQNIKDKDVIIHAISLLNPSNSNEKYHIGYVKEMQQLMKLCELVGKNAQKLIFLSSGGTVYGSCKSEPIQEECATNPINHYGSVKVCMETMIRTFAKQGMLDAHIARISNPYGPGQDYKKGVGFIDAVVRNALHNNTIDVWGDGENVRDYIYITDVCGMLWQLCNYTGTEEVFNLSTGKGVSQNQIIAYVGHELGALSVKYLPGRTVDLKRTVLSNEKICNIYKDELISVQDGIRKYIDYMKQCIDVSNERG